MRTSKRFVLLVAVGLILSVIVILAINLNISAAQPQEIIDYVFSPGQIIFKGGIWGRNTELVYTGMEENVALYFEYTHKLYQCVLPYRPGNYTIGKHSFELTYINPQDASITIRVVRNIG